MLKTIKNSFLSAGKHIWLSVLVLAINFFLVLFLLLDISLISQNLVNYLSSIISTMETNPSAFIVGDQNVAYAMNQVKTLIIWLTATIPAIYILFGSISGFLIHKIAGNKLKFWNFAGKFSLLTLIFYIIVVLIVSSEIAAFMAGGLVRILVISLLLLLLLLLAYFYLVFFSLIPSSKLSEIFRQGLFHGFRNFRGKFSVFLIFIFLFFLSLSLSLWLSRINYFAGFMAFLLLSLPIILFAKLVFVESGKIN